MDTSFAKTTKISVIIPVYNTASHLNKCVNSVLAQSYPNFEIILVDDGSTDNSLEICKILQKNNACIKLVQKQNGGVCSARNAGINAATGDYIGFVDSDDAVKNNWLFELCKANENHKADIISFGMEKIKDNKVIAVYVTDDFYAGTKNEFKKHMLNYYNSVFGSVCLKLYKTSLIKHNSISFNESIAVTEDSFFDYDAITFATSFLNVNQVLYEYYYYENSSSNKGRMDILKSFLRLANRHDDFVTQLDLQGEGLPSGEDIAQKGVFVHYLQGVVTTNNLSYTKRKQILSQLYNSDEYRRILIAQLKAQPCSASIALGKLSVRLKSPFLVIAPSQIIKLLKGK